MTGIKTLNCEEARERWHLRLEDGGADPRLEQHLAACADCRTFVAQMERVLQGLDALRAESERITILDSRASESALRSAYAPRWLVEGMRLLRVAAALAFVVFGSWYFGWHLTGSARMPEGMPIVPAVPNPARTGRAASFRLCGQTAQKYLAVPTSAPDPNVRVVWLYPVLAEPDENGEP